MAIAATGTALIGLSLLAAGCGGGAASPGVANVGTTNTAASRATAQDPMTQAVHYAACMRSHGLPNYPDPQSISQGAHQGIRIQTPDLNSPPAQAAQRTCSKYLPSGFSGGSDSAENAQHEAHLLAFARCMRTHGVPNFPDPTSSGGFPPAIAAIDRASPLVRAAIKTCLGKAAGEITFGSSNRN